MEVIIPVLLTLYILKWLPFCIDKPFVFWIWKWSFLMQLRCMAHLSKDTEHLRPLTHYVFVHIFQVFMFLYFGVLEVFGGFFDENSYKFVFFVSMKLVLFYSYLILPLYNISLYNLSQVKTRNVCNSFCDIEQN